MKLVTTLTSTEGYKTAKIYRDTEAGEYVVKFYEAHLLETGATYFTGGLGKDYKEDAILTAKHYINN